MDSVATETVITFDDECRQSIEDRDARVKVRKSDCTGNPRPVLLVEDGGGSLIFQLWLQNVSARITTERLRPAVNRFHEHDFGLHTWQ